MRIIVEKGPESKEESEELPLFAGLGPPAEPIGHSREPPACRQHGEERAEKEHHRERRYVRPRHRRGGRADEDKRIDRLHEGVKQVSLVEDGRAA